MLNQDLRLVLGIIKSNLKFKVMKKNKILKQISTHKAILNGNKIDIFITGFEIEDLKYEDEFLFSIPANEEDDLLAIFDRFDEDNRINRAEANEEFKNYKK